MHESDKKVEMQKVAREGLSVPFSGSGVRNLPTGEAAIVGLQSKMHSTRDQTSTGRLVSVGETGAVHRACFDCPHFMRLRPCSSHHEKGNTKAEVHDVDGGTQSISVKLTLSETCIHNPDTYWLEMHGNTHTHTPPLVPLFFARPCAHVGKVTVFPDAHTLGPKVKIEAACGLGDSRGTPWLPGKKQRRCQLIPWGKPRKHKVDDSDAPWGEEAGCVPISVSTAAWALD